MTDVLGPIALGDQRFDRLAQQRGPSMAEQVFGLQIDEHDATLGIDDDHRVGGGIDQLSKELVDRWRLRARHAAT
jgi:hypothetical protein